MPGEYDLAAMGRRAGFRRTSARLRGIKPTLALEHGLLAALNGLIRHIEAGLRQGILPIVREGSLARDAAFADDPRRTGQALDLLKVAIETRLTRVATDMVERVIRLEGQRHTKRFAQSVQQAIGIDLSAVLLDQDIAGPIDVALRRNAGLVKSLGDDAYRRIEVAVLDTVAKGRPTRELVKRLQDELGISKRRAKVIARDQAGKLTSDLNEARQKQAGVDRYVWRTSLDERVRPSHEIKEGRKFRWNRPPPDTGHPGEDIMCRCVAEGLVEF